MTSAKRTRRAMLTGAFFVGVVLVAGCSSGGSSSAPASLAPASSSAAASSPAAAPASSLSSPASSAGSTPAAPGTAACATRDLRASAGIAQGAAGSVYQVIDFTNISGAACTLFGYPGVALAGGAPVTQIGAAATRSTASPVKLVTLAAGGTANALLRITQAANYPASRCNPVTSSYLQIYPPNQTTPIFLAYKSTGCSLTAVNLLSIGAVQAGNGG